MLRILDQFDFELDAPLALARPAAGEPRTERLASAERRAVAGGLAVRGRARARRRARAAAAAPSTSRVAGSAELQAAVAVADEDVADDERAVLGHPEDDLVAAAARMRDDPGRQRRSPPCALPASGRPGSGRPSRPRSACATGGEQDVHRVDRQDVAVERPPEALRILGRQERVEEEDSRPVL